MTDAEDQPSRLARSLLPGPTLSFTLPSIHDGLAIDCRVYHPQSLDQSPSSPPWRKHAAVFAHPYAPLGGCYDDPVVDIAAGTLLKLGFLVGTFNFRGAQGSAGRTSWTAKAERADYASVVGFLSYYVHYLDPFRPHLFQSVPTTSPIAEASDYMGPHGGSRPVTPSAPHDNNKSPLFLMGGYSYGSMITMQLPSLQNILHQFDTPACSSHAAENTTSELNTLQRCKIQHLVAARPAYLLVSPLQGLINNLASFNLLPRRPSWKGLTRSMSSPAATASPTGELSPSSDTALSLEEAEAKLVRNPTLAIYGDNDGFVPVRKLRPWAARLEGIPHSSFRAHEVSGASHFWAQGRPAYTLKDAIKTFAESLLAKDGS
ncbi:unnamed protein product [Sordaria macrospora k-hell]|uniref:WGS project CABT00000000 data, contig 2.30 n=1 Tax=Sordaria macrospora (strain ATCC MYA-333 / DSM 997 / K(L3346) / K-hell) TaxID=771870 RepID=F7W5C1_SORMK|nr:uncharacterized protein SMAC_05669 [Sordaria macrospora k-hell]CCC12709.1 unnamed protein product [Sordaria macrospora k-hell]